MKNILILLCVISFGLSQSTFSDPQPTFDNPRKVVFQVNNSDVKIVNQNLGTIYNILKEYPSESLNIVVITYGNGVRALRKDYDKKTLSRIASLMEYEVEFIVCRNTMEAMKWVDEDFIEDVGFVQAGIAELIERQVDGYIGINAF